MQERIRQLRSALATHRSVPLFRGVLSYVRTRKPGDQLLLVLFGGLVIVASMASIIALEQSLLVVQPAYGGTLTEGEVGSPRFINPLLAISDTDQDLTALTYAGLMGESSDGSLVPVLAKSYTVSSDKMTYTFTLRDSAKFSDGTPVTANDVVFTVNKAQDPNLKSPEYANWNAVSVKAIDAKTVQFTLSEPYGPFLENTTLGILPQHLWKDVTDEEFPFSDLQVKPVGAGPFRMDSLSQEADGNIPSYRVSADPDYALGRPYLDGINFIFYTDAVALQTGLKKHAVESGYGITAPTMLTAPYARVFAVFFNPGESQLFTHQPVRQALSVAIDRETIVEKFLGGYATPLIGPVPPGSGVPNLPIPPSVDRIASSTNLLSANGWTFASSTGEWKDSSGNVLSITLKTSNVPELKAMAESVQSDWRALGVQTSIQLYEPGELAQNVIGPRAYQALLFGMVVGRGDDLYDFWDSKERTSPGLNVAEYNNPDVDTLLTKLRGETDPAERKADLASINEKIASQYPAAFIEAPDFVYAVPKDLKGVILPQITSPADRFATVATWYRRTESVWPFLARNK